jgi:plasmid stabilization system protein ParE
LYDAAKRLNLFPQSGRVVPEVGRQEYREIIYRRSHRVIYRIETSRVLVLTVRNCAQRLDLAEVVPIDRKR